MHEPFLWYSLILVTEYAIIQAYIADAKNTFDPLSYRKKAKESSCVAHHPQTANGSPKSSYWRKAHAITTAERV
ncbi:MAG: hypothetical protein RR821_13225, partial [Clostridia bacterium]